MNDLQHIGGAWECADAWMDQTAKRFVTYPFYFSPTIEHIVNTTRWTNREIEVISTACGRETQKAWPDTLAYAERGTETP